MTEIIDIQKEVAFAIKKAAEKHGDGFNYFARHGTEVDLTILKDGEYVCAGGSWFHILMTPKNG